eukprot:14195600-Alexandrium_andersonii.AAC.1
MFEVSPACWAQGGRDNGVVHDGPCVLTAPSNCLLRQPGTPGLSMAACRSSCGVGGPLSVSTVVKKVHAAPQRWDVDQAS